MASNKSSSNCTLIKGRKRFYTMNLILMHVASHTWENKVPRGPPLRKTLGKQNLLDKTRTGSGSWDVIHTNRALRRQIDPSFSVITNKQPLGLLLLEEWVFVMTVNGP